MRVGAWVAALVFVGCSTVAPNRRLPAARLAPPSSYGTSTASEPLNALLHAKLTGRAPELLRYEPRLAVVANAVGQLTAQHGVLPANSLLQWLLWRAGVVGAPLQTRVRTFQVETQLELEVSTWANELSQDVTRPTAYALARFEGAPGGVALVTADDEVKLEPVPSTLKPGAPLELRGSIRVTGEDLEVLLEDDGVRVRAAQLPLDANGGFALRLPGPTTAGVRFVELLRREVDAETGVSARRPVALFPLAVGVPVPAAPPKWVSEPRPNPSRRDQWAEQLMQTYAEERRRMGLAAPQSDARLEQLAAQLAGMRGVSGMQGDENLAELVTSQGLVSREAWARFSTADTLDELVHETLLRPSWRRVFLSDAPVVVAPVLSQHEGRVLAWEVVAVAVPVLDAALEAQRLRDTLMARRRELGGPPLERALKVEPLLQAFVDAACRDDVEELELRVLAKSLQLEGVRGALMGNAVHRASVNDGPLPEEFEDLVATKHPRVAVATCQSKGPGLQWSAVLIGELE